MLHSPLFTRALRSPAPAFPCSTNGSRAAINKAAVIDLCPWEWDGALGPPSPIPCYRGQDCWASPRETGRFWGISGALVSKEGQLGDKWGSFICAAEVSGIIWPKSGRRGGYSPACRPLLCPFAGHCLLGAGRSQQGYNSWQYFIVARWHRLAWGWLATSKLGSLYPQHPGLLMPGSAFPRDAVTQAKNVEKMRL